MLSIIFISIFLSLLILILFFLASKFEKLESHSLTSFECGYSSYFFSRFSFSIHFYIIGLIFLFLDLEICLIMPYLIEFSENLNMNKFLLVFVVFLLLSLMLEWFMGKLEWKN